MQQWKPLKSSYEFFDQLAKLIIPKGTNIEHIMQILLLKSDNTCVSNPKPKGILSCRNLWLHLCPRHCLTVDLLQDLFCRVFQSHYYFLNVSVGRLADTAFNYLCNPSVKRLVEETTTLFWWEQSHLFHINTVFTSVVVIKMNRDYFWYFTHLSY